MGKTALKFKSIYSLEEYSTFSFFSDAKLETEDETIFDIHRIILAKNSLYFQALFRGTSRDKEFLIPGITGECLNDVLCHLYTDNKLLVTRDVPELLIASDYLLLSDLHLDIKKSVKANLTMDNCLRLLLSSKLIHDKDVFLESLRFIEIHFERIVSRRECGLADIPLEILKSILSSTNLCIESEKAAWLAIAEWVQGDVVERLCNVPELLTYLAYKELDEITTDEILGHNIIVDNPHLENLITLKSEEDTTDNLTRLQKFITEIPNSHGSPRAYRTPPRLHIIAELNKDFEGKCVQIYVTYDEKLDLWRKIADINFLPYYLLNIKHNVYICDCLGRKFMNIDLRTKELVQTTANRRERFHSCAVVFEERVYVFSEIFDDVYSTSYDVDIYDPITNSWADGVLLPNVVGVQAVSVRKNIYVVGFLDNTNDMTAYEFSSDSQIWDPIPGPKIFRFDFLFFGYRNKLFMIGGTSGSENLRDVEIFDLDSRTWRKSEDLPFEYSTLHVANLNDKIFVYDYHYEINSKIVCWKDDLQCWEKMDVPPTQQTSRFAGLYKERSDVKFHVFCTVDDPETIRLLSKENRHPSACLERTDFDVKNTFGKKWFTGNKEIEV